jgi:Tfp pilus assembly protein PilO
MTSADLLAMIKKQPLGFACGLLCLICAGLLYFRGGKIAENRAAFETKSAEATRILANVRNSEKLADQVVEIQALSKEMESRLVRAGQLAVNLQYFYKLEAETEVKLLDVRQGVMPKAGKTLYTGIPFNVSVQGSFRQVLAFLQKLENGPHFCRFSSVNYTKLASVAASRSSGGGDLSAITLSINLELLGVP